MSFWDKFGKVSAITAEVGAAAGAITLGVSSCLKNRFNRKMKQQEMDLKRQQQLLNQELKLKELELKQHQIDSNYNRDLQLTQMKAAKDVTINQAKVQKDCNIQNMRSQQAIQTTGINAQAAVTIYGQNSTQANNGYFQNENERIAIDNHCNKNNNQSRYITQSYDNMQMMNMGAINQQPINNNQNLSVQQIQQKILDAKHLLDQGIITEQEFVNIKKDILDNSF